MNPDLKTQQEQQQRREKEQVKYRETCDKYVSKGLAWNVTVQFLIDRLVGMGCEPPKEFIRCVDCGDDVMAAGGFGVVEEKIIASPANESSSASKKDDKDAVSLERLQKEVRARANKEQCHRTQAELKSQIDAQKDGKVKLKLLPEIFLCQNHLQNETHAHQSMVHELIHAVDLCRTKMDPINNCVHLACTEIRAENLSGECGFMRELTAGKISSIPAHNKACVKRRALLSVKANPNCKDCAEEAVEAAFERCYKDTFPFDRHPNLKY